MSACDIIAIRWCSANSISTQAFTLVNYYMQPVLPDILRKCCELDYFKQKHRFSDDGIRATSDIESEMNVFENLSAIGSLGNVPLSGLYQPLRDFVPHVHYPYRTRKGPTLATGP